MFSEKLKNLLKTRLGPANLERARIVNDCIQGLRQTFSYTSPKPKGYPVPLENIRNALVNVGIKQGDVILVHSSSTNLFQASINPPSKPIENIIQYARDIIEILIDLVGEDGTILMPTDSVRNLITSSMQGKIFNYTRAPSRRGWITEFFRRRSDVIRSVHPLYNVTGWGKLAEDLIKDHHKSSPYSMDTNSPWYKLTEVDGKVLLLGVTFEANSSILLPEYLHPDELPHGVYFNKPYKMKYLDYDGTVKEMDLMIHAMTGHANKEVSRFCDYLDRKYHIYKRINLHNSQVICYKSKDQYEALYQEIKNNKCWHDLRYLEYSGDE